MNIVQTHFIFIWKSNGPSGFYTLEKVYETEAGYYFYESKNSGFFQIEKQKFEKALEYTLNKMPDLKVEYSQPREKLSQNT